MGTVDATDSILKPNLKLTLNNGPFQMIIDDVREMRRWDGDREPLVRDDANITLEDGVTKQVGSGTGSMAGGR